MEEKPITPSSKQASATKVNSPLPVKLAITFLVFILYGIYALDIINIDDSKLLPTSITSHIIFFIILFIIYFLSKKILTSISDTKNLVTLDPQGKEVQYMPPTLLMMTFFELSALLGFTSIFIFSSPVYMIAGSIFTIYGLWFIVPRK